MCVCVTTLPEAPLVIPMVLKIQNQLSLCHTLNSNKPYTPLSYLYYLYD